MMLANFFSSNANKLNKIRKQKWSGPIIIGIFLIISMLIVFGLETIGIFQKEKNLDSRTVTPTITNKSIIYIYFSNKGNKEKK
jgi:Na+/proline symporter